MISLFNTDVYRFAAPVADVIRSGHVGPGGRTRAFEASFTNLVGTRHAITTTSGTTALMLSLLSLDIEPGSTVLCPAYGMCAGANVAKLLGFRVRLVDVDNMGNMDASGLDFEDQMVSACIFIDHNGRTEGIQAVRAECNKWGVPVIEDACQGLGCDLAGTFGRMACFSFSPQKLITTGQGGMVVTDDDHLAERLRQIVDHGGDWRETRTFRRTGGNFRFNDILATFGLSQLAQFDQIRRLRASIRERYHVIEPRISPEEGWCVLFPSREPAGLIVHLKARGIEAARLYPPVHWSPLHSQSGGFPGADAIYNRDVYLPGHNALTSGDIEFICQCVKEFEDG